MHIIPDTRPIVRAAVAALDAFGATTARQATQLLGYWARYDELTAADIDVVLTYFGIPTRRSPHAAWMTATRPVSPTTAKPTSAKRAAWSRRTCRSSNRPAGTSPSTARDDRPHRPGPPGLVRPTRLRRARRAPFAEHVRHLLRR